MIVIKIGGSLYNSPYLKDWLASLVKLQNRNIIIAPGGGPFADQVRVADKQFCLSSQTAHHMAVLAMQQYAYLIHDLNENISILKSCKDLKNNSVHVWLPYQDVKELCDYPKSWQTTSDSLAVWLASSIGAESLCVVKSASVKDKSLEYLKSEPVVDQYFKTALNKFNGQLRFYHSSESNQFLNDYYD